MIKSALHNIKLSLIISHFFIIYTNSKESLQNSANKYCLLLLNGQTVKIGR